MALFNYKAKDQSGIEHKGDIEASDSHAAALLLRRKGFIVIALDEKGNINGGLLGRFLNKVSFAELTTITRQLSIMIASGLVLSEAIDILEEQQTNKYLKKILGEVSRDIKGGMTLSASMSRYPDVFPTLYVNLVKSGESSGKMDQILTRMADSLEKEREFKARVKGALIYPVIVITMMFGVMLIMIVFVIPKLTSLYSESTLELPLPTKILIFISSTVVNFWWLIVAVLVLGFILLKRWRNTPEGAKKFDSLILKTPLVGRITMYVNLTNFSRTFGLLISAGVPLLEAISIVSNVIQNSVFKDILNESYRGVEKGLPFSSLLTSSYFPKIVSQMVKVGEETGRIDEIFFKLSDYFESESDHLVKNLTVAIEPIILVALGIGVAFLVIAIVLPIYSLTTSF